MGIKGAKIALLSGDIKCMGENFIFRRRFVSTYTLG
jgi:hypothetical protein